MKPAVLFKFIEPQFAQQAVELGAFRLGTFDDFRQMDESDGIGDADEGVRVGLLDGTIDGLPDADRIRILRDAGFGGSDVALARMRDVRFSRSGMRYRSPPVYILCFSESVDATGLPPAKSALLEVTNVEEFLLELGRAHPDRLSGRRAHRSVTYDDVSHDIIASPVPPPDPFRNGSHSKVSENIASCWSPRALRASPL